MSRRQLIAVAALGLSILVVACFGPAIGGRQFCYRDAAHFYYPLYQRVQTEWDAGRVPLWEPEENAGMPLLGNPTAAVLYPGKLIYTLLPYPLAARVYVIAHTLLAFAGTLVLSRRLGIGGVGSVIAALSYAFGAPILFQYCNIIFLVGAAWVPWGIAAIDGWLRSGERRAIGGLAVVLAMQVLGGDPQAAYLEGLCAGVYAILLGWGEAKRRPMSSGRKIGIAIGLVVVLAAWVGITLALAYYLPQIRPKKVPPPTFGWNKHLPTLFTALWGGAGLVFLLRWRKGRADHSRLGRRLVGLAAAAGLAGAIAGAQLLPVIEFTRLTGRAADEGTHDIYQFSLEPYRVAEFLWPNLFGTTERGNRAWLFTIPPVANHRVWVPSIYLGGLTAVLALAGICARGGPTWRPWMVGVVGVSLVAAMGDFLGPLWFARNFEASIPYVGPHDPPKTNAIRLDGYLRDGDGSVYSIVSTIIPGFQQFRYPSKLLTFTIIGLAVLAGHGWDRIGRGMGRFPTACTGASLAISLIVLITVVLKRDDLIAFFAARGDRSALGPFDPGGAVSDLRNALIHGSIVMAAALAALASVARRPRLVGALAIVFVAADLAAANARHVLTCDQAEFDRTPRVIELIAEAERANPSRGPFRVHRMPIWSPYEWLVSPSDHRAIDFVRWEHDTIQPKYGINHGIHFTSTQGVAELYDYEWFFGPFTVKLPASLAAQLRVDPKDRITYYPRRGFDLWNTRYFILPAATQWTDADRGVASLVLHEVEPIYPKPGAFEGPDGEGRRERWFKSEDVQIVRNNLAMPRAWVVHDAKFFPPVEGLDRGQRTRPMEEMLYMGDPFWNDPDRIVHDPRQVAWFEVDDPSALGRFVTRGRTGADEAVTVVEQTPRRVELSVTLDRPGFVILADVHYPGWIATIDGKPATILRANRMMRGLAVDAGKHAIVYEYRPNSFIVGVVATAAGLIALGLTMAWAGHRGDPAARAGVSRPD